MHTVRIDDAAPGYIVRKSVLIHIGPAITATNSEEGEEHKKVVHREYSLNY